ncbi:MAG: Clp protease ClpP [Clostridiales bacterium]|nr:Clp protease ClpP [Clostridiales bacterium]
MKKNNGMFEFKQSAKNPNTLELYIYSDVQGDYFDYETWQTVTSETSAEYFRAQLAEFPNAEEIEVYINSLGGSCFEGNAIYSQLKRHSAHKTIYIDGYACSIASVIAMAGDRVIMSPNAVMMIHDAWSALSGNAAQLRAAADRLDKVSEASRQAYVEKCGGKLTEQQIAEYMDRETYFTAKECVELGLADEISSGKADSSDLKDIKQEMSAMAAANADKMLCARIAEVITTAERGKAVNNDDSSDTNGAENEGTESESDTAADFNAKVDEVINKYFKM